MDIGYSKEMRLSVIFKEGTATRTSIGNLELILINLIKTKLIYKDLSMKYFTGIEKKTYISA
jgi:hypothetical protein